MADKVDMARDICCETDYERAARIGRLRREKLLTELGAIEGLSRIAETLRAHLEDSIPTILDAGLLPSSDPLGAARELAAALGEVLSDLVEATS
jgi:hypothetical protein